MIVQPSKPLLEWLARTGCTRVAVHFDVDTVDSNEIVLGLDPTKEWKLIIFDTEADHMPSGDEDK